MTIENIKCFKTLINDDSLLHTVDVRTYFKLYKKYIEDNLIDIVESNSKFTKCKLKLTITQDFIKILKDYIKNDKNYLKINSLHHVCNSNLQDVIIANVNINLKKYYLNKAGFENFNHLEEQIKHISNLIKSLLNSRLKHKIIDK